MAKASAVSEISLSYSLFDLPTTQHKAGLAGLLLLIDSMQQRRLGPVPRVTDFTATSVKLSFTREALQATFDDLYDAEIRETEVKQKWQGASPKREETVETPDPKTGKVKKTKIYVYDIVVPKATFLEHRYPGDEHGWLKLWRDMLWNTLRGRPTTRLVYDERAQKKPSGEAEGTWKELNRRATDAQKGKVTTGEVPSSLLIGAQALNAERVPFSGRIEQNFLLHFWPLATQVFVPEAIDREGTRDFKGYVLAVPEVSDLQEFCDLYPQILGGLDPQMRGFRPKAAIVDLPIEGGLEFLRHLFLLSQQKAGATRLKYSLSAVELFYLDKQGNNIKTLATERIVYRPSLLQQYEGVRSLCRNPFFKSQQLLNLLREAEWHEGFTRLFAFHPCEFFLHSEKTPTSFPFFSSDVRKQFENINSEFQRQQEAYTMAESPEQKPQSLEKRIYDMIGSYVRYKTEARSGIKWADFKDKKTAEGKLAIPSVYIEARQKVCADVFLAMRSRREQDFIEYFTGAICSAPQFLPAEDYVLVSQALLDEGGWEKVKALSMLALAAHS
jgi:CRISPR-associated protein Cmx8